MSVIEYKEYEHGGGFIGFRVARTIGCESDYRQKYFSLKEYSYSQAKKLANKLDKEWSAEAAEVRKNAERKIYQRKNLGKHYIVNGFRSTIEANEKFRAGEYRYYFTPCFLVNIPRGKGCLTFRTRSLGYEQAFAEATKKYIELYELDKAEAKALVKKCPDVTLFTGYLLNKLRKRGLKLSKEKLLELLNCN